MLRGIDPILGPDLLFVLRAMGHEVFVAHDGQSALADLSRIRPDIAFLDIAVPGMSANSRWLSPGCSTSRRSLRPCPSPRKRA